VEYCTAFRGEYLLVASEMTEGGYVHLTLLSKTDQNVFMLFKSGDCAGQDKRLSAY